MSSAQQQLGCPRGSFSLVSNVVGLPSTTACQACWKCCIYPELYGKCPEDTSSACRCNIGATCVSSLDYFTTEDPNDFSLFCGSGLVCDLHSDTCRRPANMTFSEVYHMYEPPPMTARAFWNYEDRCPAHQVILYGSPHVNISTLPPTTRPGCPCIDNLSAQVFRCPAGFMCSTSAASAQEIQEVDRGVAPHLVAMQAICVPCSPGQHCPEGTVEATASPCPEGYFCASPQAAVPCPPGTFCRSGSIVPQPCQAAKLVLTSVLLLEKETTVISAIGDASIPLYGNTCPANATTPTTLCPGGYYCHNTSAAPEPCPIGYFCRPGSVAPTRCPPLSSCQAASSAPGWPWGCIILTFGILLAMLVSKVIARLKDTTSRTLLLSRLPFKTMRDKTTKTAGLITEQDDIYADAIARDIFADTDFTTQRESRRTLLLMSSTAEDLDVPDLLDVLEQRRLTALEVSRMSVQKSSTERPWLCPTSCRVRPCAFNAIMGPSGCGKSILLDLFRGKMPRAHIRGRVRLTSRLHGDVELDLQHVARRQGCNGIDILKAIHGFVPQDDVLLPELTVRENLLFSYRLNVRHLPKKWAGSIVDFFLEKLALSNISGVPVGSVERRMVSGGQRKRVSIGMALVTLPALLLMDEPTSGLDSAAAQTFATTCKTITALGITCVAVLHQPRYASFMLLDEVILLSKYGTIFFGSPSMAITYFERGLRMSLDVNDNPADALMDIVSKHQEELARVWKDGLKGYRWVQRCSTTYPTLDAMMQTSIRFDRQAIAGIRDMLSHANVQMISPTDLSWAFDTFGTKVSRDSAAMLISILQRKYGVKEVTEREVLLACSDIADAAILEKRYANVIERVYLLDRIPESIQLVTIQGPSMSPLKSTVNPLRVMFLARMFSARLIKRIRSGSASRPPTLQGLRSFEKEILQTILVAKLRPSLRRRRRSSAAYTVPVIQPPPPSTSSPALIPGEAATVTITVGDQTSSPKPRDMKRCNIGHHMCILMWRRLITIWRSPWQVQIIIQLAAAFIVGLIHGNDWTLRQFPSNTVMAMACLGVLSTVTHIRTFPLDRLMMVRDMGGTVSALAYFCAYSITDLVWIVFMPLTFGPIYYMITVPAMSFGHLLLVSIMVCWWASGMAYAVSTMPLPLPWLTILAVFIAVIFGAFINGLNPSIGAAHGFLKSIMALSYNRWAMEALVIEECKHVPSLNLVFSILARIGICGQDALGQRYRGRSIPDLVSDITRLTSTTDVVQQECIYYHTQSYLALLGLGLAFRVLALLTMMLQHSVVVQRFLWNIMH